MILPMIIDAEAALDLDQREAFVRSMWSDLYADYSAYINNQAIRDAVNASLHAAEPEELITNWIFVLFNLANQDFRAGEIKTEREFVVSLQTAGLVAFDPNRKESVYLHSA